MTQNDALEALDVLLKNSYETYLDIAKRMEIVAVSFDEYAECWTRHTANCISEVIAGRPKIYSAPRGAKA